jgi:anaerobic selenocysteine-containing dehydrogenase
MTDLTNGTNLPTVCVLCSHNCGIRVDVKDGRITAVRGDETNPITKGYRNKAFSIPHYVEHRVPYPSAGATRHVERIDCDTAITEIAAKLDAIRRRHSPRAIALVGIGGQGNHMDAPYGLGFLRGIGSRRWFNAFAQEKTQHNLLDQWMFDASPSVFLHADTAHAQFVLVLGTNPKISNRGHNATDTFKMLAEDPRRTVVVADPRETETTRTATRHLRLRPGTDVYLLLAMAAVIVREGLTDDAFLREHTIGIDLLRAELAPSTAAMAALRPRGRRGARDARGSRMPIWRRSSTTWAWSRRRSTLNAYLIRVLLTLTDNIGRVGGDVFLENFLAPVIDRDRVSEPERAIASGIPAIRALGNAGMMSPTLVPEEVLVDHPERIRAIVVEGANPILSYSDAPRWREARERLDLLVVIDPAMTETARLADYVLPVPTGYEKWETASFPRGAPEIFVQVRPPVLAPRIDALTEPEIYVRLAAAMGLFGTPPPSC